MTFDDSVKYQKSHEWARKDGENFVVGISDYAQDSLGDVVFVELPEVGNTLKKGETFGVVESVKAASDVYMPVGGEILETNTELEDSPEIINEDPFGKGWLLKVKPTDASEYDSLMTAKDYEEYSKTIEE